MPTQRKKPRQYATLAEYLDLTGTNQEQLLAKVRETTGHGMSRAMLSMILRGSRRCSKWNAYILNMVTGVPIEEMLRWPRSTNTGNSLAGDGDHRVIL